MKTISTTLFHRVLPPERPGPGPHRGLVLLHGRGADEEDLLGLASAFDERFFVISARAPFPYDFGGYTWYDAGTAGAPEPRMFQESCDRLSRFLDDIRTQYPLDPQKLVLQMGCVIHFPCIAQAIGEGVWQQRWAGGNDWNCSAELRREFFITQGA